MPIKTFNLFQFLKPQQVWKLSYGSVFAQAVLADPIRPKAGGRGNVHQQIIVLPGSTFRDEANPSCKPVYVKKRSEIRLHFLNGDAIDRPLLFSSLSAAACVLSGNSKDGRLDWTLPLDSAWAGKWIRELNKKELNIDEALEASQAQEFPLCSYCLPLPPIVADLRTGE